MQGDIVAYEDQLIGIAHIGRICCTSSLPYLFQLLQTSVSLLINNTTENENMRHMAMDKVHWLLLITGNLIADTPHGQTSTIPDEILSYVNIRANGQINNENNGNNGNNIDGNAGDDALIGVISLVFNLIEFENR